MKKTNENIKSDLEYDMKEFEKKYPKITFKGFTVDSLKYPIYSKIYDYGNGTTDYCCFMNPVRFKAIFCNCNAWEEGYLYN